MELSLTERGRTEEGVDILNAKFEMLSDIQIETSRGKPGWRHISRSSVGEKPRTKWDQVGWVEKEKSSKDFFLPVVPHKNHPQPCRPWSSSLEETWAPGRTRSAAISWPRTSVLKPLLSYSVWAAAMEYHRLGDLNATEIYFLQFCKLGSPDQGTHRFGVWWEPASWFLSSHCVVTWWRRQGGPPEPLLYNYTYSIPEGSALMT